MLSLQSVIIPVEFSRLCRLSMSERRDEMRTVSSIIALNPGLSLLCEKVFKEFSSDGNIEAMVQVLGWRSFRDRLASVFLYHKKNNRFPDESDLSLVKQISDFEKRFSKYSPASSSRVFLLGLYLKFLEIELIENSIIMDGNLLNIPSEIDSILAEGKSKSEKLDFIILFVWHAIAYFGRDKALIEFQNKAFSFEKIKDSFDDDFYKTMITNYIVYSTSINDEQLFINNEV
jgi:hypothetical protein